MAYDLALLPGDGIGPEVIEAAVPVLREASQAHGVRIETTAYDWNSSRWLETGEMMPEDAPDRIRSHDAILHGAMGHPDVPDVISSREGHIRLRNAFDQYLNLRPAYLFDGVASPLSGYDNGDIDILWYRENSEGEYVDIGGRLSRGGESELAIQSAVFTRKGVERVARAAFEAATERSGHVTNVTKSNALPHGPVFWDEIVHGVAEEYPGVTCDDQFVDAANMNLVLQPEAFDVVVASNLFSDVLTDLTAAVTGGIGLAPSANLTPDTDNPDMFEPVHGSAPDIAGQGIANPIAAILSGGLMFDSFDEDGVAQSIRTAVAAHLADTDAPRTPDRDGSAGTDAVARDIRSRIGG